MTPKEERAYIEGKNAAHREQLTTAINGLGPGYVGRKAAALILERSVTVAVLRRICAEHGDNDWDDDLHLADVLEKHLARYLGERP